MLSLILLAIIVFLLVMAASYAFVHRHDDD
jgi:hypothetical protein